MGEVHHVISWRYHVVSIVAVVLAFGLGLLAGTSVVGDAFADRLRQNYNRVQQQRDQALDTVAVYDRFAEALQPILRDGVLDGQAAVVVTMEGVDRPARRTVDELTAAGMDVVATLELTRGLADPEAEGSTAILEEVLGVSTSDPDLLRQRIADDLAVRLAVGAGVGDDDMLGRLLTEGLVTADRDLDPAALPGVGGAGQVVVIAAGGVPPAGLPGPSTLLVPMAARLVKLDVPAAAVGPSEDQYGFVSAVREDSEIPDCAMVTLDDVDLTIGGIALAMGLDRLLEDPDPGVRPGGDYGLAGDAILPGGEVPGSCRL